MDGEMPLEVGQEVPLILQLEVQDVDQFLVDIVKGKLKYWSFVNLSLARHIIIMN